MALPYSRLIPRLLPTAQPQEPVLGPEHTIQVKMGSAMAPPSAETSARDVQTLTGVANSMSGHQPTDHQQATGNAVPSTLSPSSTSAYTSVLITTTATVNGHLTTFATLVPTTLSSFPQDSSPSLKPPAVAAAVVGTLIATGLLAGLGYLFVKRRKQRKMQTAMQAARKESMRRGRRVLDDDDGDDDEDGLPMRYAGSGSAGSHSHSMSTSYQYGVVGSLPPDSVPSSSSFSYNRSQDTFSFSRLSNNEFAGRDPAEVRRLRAGRTGSSSGSIFREDFNSEPLGGARLITTNASTPRPGSMASSPSSPSHDGTRTPTSNPFDGGVVGYFPHKRSSTASSSALGLLEAIGGVTPSASLEVVNMSRTSSPSPTHEGTQLPYHQQKRSSVSSIRTHSLPSPKSTLPFAAAATTTTTAATSSRPPPMTSPPSAFQYPPSGRSPSATFTPVTSPPTTTNPRSPQHFPTSASSASPRSSLQGSYNPRNSLPPGGLPPGAASPPGPLARTSILVDEQFGVTASNYGLPATDHHYIMPPNRRRSSSGATSISQVMATSPQPNFDPSDMAHGREKQKRRDSFVLPDIPVSGTGSLREKDRGSKVDLVQYLSEDEDGGVKGGVGRGGNERRPRASFST
ncbi:hypothetical protein FS837_012211 [Tulasnella sp. UAMH 9824]|nr:hypothetical protein FS837_012211 [Tulasnella sp. UAMH 9824]